MLKITNRVRALPLRSVYFRAQDASLIVTPLEAPVFRLTVTNWVDTGDIVFSLNGVQNDLVQNFKAKTLNCQ